MNGEEGTAKGGGEAATWIRWLIVVGLLVTIVGFQVKLLKEIRFAQDAASADRTGFLSSQISQVSSDVAQLKAQLVPTPSPSPCPAPPCIASKTRGAASPSPSP